MKVSKIPSNWRVESSRKPNRGSFSVDKLEGNGTNFRCSTLVHSTVSPDNFYVSKKALQNFKKQAESEMQHQSKVHASGGILRFVPGAVEV